MHGLGDTGKGWAGNLDKLQLELPNKISMICPTAPMRPVTLNQEDAVRMEPKGSLLRPIDIFPLTCKSMPTTCWFDWTPMNIKRPEDVCHDLEWIGIDASVSHVHQLLELEVPPSLPFAK